jgi:hypothetical protein
MKQGINIKKIIWLLFYQSYNIVLVGTLGYLFVYSIYLRKQSIYFTYIMLFLGGLLLGYIFADQAYRFLKKNPKQ